MLMPPSKSCWKLAWLGTLSRSFMAGTASAVSIRQVQSMDFSSGFNEG
jgi:hypothetical protein